MDPRHYPPETPSGDLLVLAHGAGAGQTHPFMTTVARGLAARGVGVVTFDFPYMQQRRRAPDRAPVLEAAFREAIAKARELAGGGRRIFIGGKSMGGRIATHLAADDSHPNVRSLIRGVICLGYPLHPPGRPDQPRTAHLPSITVPVLIVQGEHDAFGTPTELGPVIAAMHTDVTIHVVAGGDHSLSTGRRGRGRSAANGGDLDRVIDVIAEWMRKVP